MRWTLTVLAALLVLGCGDRTGALPTHLQAECVSCEPTDEFLCLDGVDSDEDGLTDCDDPDCGWAPSCPWKGSEDTALRCADGLDNDANGFTDCGDWSCSETSACRPETRTAEDSTTTCSNGRDDDWDGFVDCADFDCELICGQ